MLRYFQKSLSRLFRKRSRKSIFYIRNLIFPFALFFGLTANGQQTSKIQQTVDALKASYYCEDQDYHTDGQRVVWVKSYKKWTPEDWSTIEKEAPQVIVFLNQAIQHRRYDVVEQLLPNYYRDHGGVKAFAIDIVREQAKAKI